MSNFHQIWGWNSSLFPGLPNFLLHLKKEVICAQIAVAVLILRYLESAALGNSCLCAVAWASQRLLTGTQKILCSCIPLSFRKLGKYLCVLHNKILLYGAHEVHKCLLSSESCSPGKKAKVQGARKLSSLNLLEIFKCLCALSP